MIAVYALAGVLLLLISVLLLLPSDKEVKVEAEEEGVSPAISIPIFSSKPKIQNGILIAGIDVGGLTEEKAVHLLESSLSNQCENQDMIVTYGGKSLSLRRRLPSPTGMWNLL